MSYMNGGSHLPADQGILALPMPSERPRSSSSASQYKGYPEYTRNGASIGILPLPGENPAEYLPLPSERSRSSSNATQPLSNRDHNNGPIPGFAERPRSTSNATQPPSLRDRNNGPMPNFSERPRASSNATQPPCLIDRSNGPVMGFAERPRSSSNAIQPSQFGNRRPGALPGSSERPRSSSNAIWPPRLKPQTNHVKTEEHEWVSPCSSPNGSFVHQPYALAPAKGLTLTLPTSPHLSDHIPFLGTPNQFGTDGTEFQMMTPTSPTSSMTSSDTAACSFFCRPEFAFHVAGCPSSRAVTSPALSHRGPSFSDFDVINGNDNDMYYQAANLPPLALPPQDDVSQPKTVQTQARSSLEPVPSSGPLLNSMMSSSSSFDNVAAMGSMRSPAAAPPIDHHGLSSAPQDMALRRSPNPPQNSRAHRGSEFGWDKTGRPVSSMEALQQLRAHCHQNQSCIPRSSTVESFKAPCTPRDP